MAKSEYYEPKILPGEKEQPGILVDAVALLELYLRALPMMNATDRKRYGDRAVNLILDVIADFQMAYDFEDDREAYVRSLCRSVSKFIFLSRVIGETAAISIRLCLLPNLECRRNGLLKRKYNFKYHTKDDKRTTYYLGGFVPLPAPLAA